MAHPNAETCASALSSGRCIEKPYRIRKSDSVREREMNPTRFDFARYSPPTPRECRAEPVGQNVLSEGVNPKMVATLLGHSPDSVDLIMSTYGHLLPCDGERAAQTMGDILIREDGPTGEIVSLDFNPWSDATESSTMYGRRRA